jgi:hypothetical protein
MCYVTFGGTPADSLRTPGADTKWTDVLTVSTCLNLSRGSSVSVVFDYELDDQAIEV